jgi:hypothetical protein
VFSYLTIELDGISTSCCCVVLCERNKLANLEVTSEQHKFEVFENKLGLRTKMFEAM